MKLKSTALVAAVMVVATLLSSPVYAEKVVVSDAMLDTIMGAGNDFTAGGSSTSTVTGLNANGNIQIGSYQWSDNHTGDLSVNKGANVQSGDNSMVQQNATSTANALAWGAVAQSVTNNTADIAGNQVTQSWAILFIGGF